MCPTPAPDGRHWDGSPRALRRPRTLRVTTTSPSRLLRAGQTGRCRHCGSRIDLYPRPDQRPIALHPAELTVTDVPKSCRWHLSGGIAYPHGDNSAWCRIPHAVLCPHRTSTCQAGTRLEAIRRQLAVRARRLIDTRALTPAPPVTPQPDAPNPADPTAPSSNCCCAATLPSSGSRSCAASPRPATGTAAPTSSSPPPAQPGCGNCCPPPPGTANSPCPMP
ncbi:MULTISPECIES: DUF6083 domain-containing protein [Streptomyces]|uniref:DUF6083 domain-containing protein n=1 Tax=Streptomyces TaxID=1883 RepID=UPI001F2AA8E7|nr:DUF6083 domain-containing protein [Streptomyces sp. CNS654]